MKMKGEINMKKLIKALRLYIYTYSLVKKRGELI
nr:MAG TPA: hypothetical protein [Caudoviricetes sp.]